MDMIRLRQIVCEILNSQTVLGIRRRWESAQVRERQLRIIQTMLLDCVTRNALRTCLNAFRACRICVTREDRFPTVAESERSPIFFALVECGTRFKRSCIAVCESQMCRPVSTLRSCRMECTTLASSCSSAHRRLRLCRLLQHHAPQHCLHTPCSF